MIISLLMIGLVLGGGFSWFMEEKRAESGKLICLLFILLFMAAFIIYLMTSPLNFAQLQITADLAWIDVFNVRYRLALDHLSNLLLILTFMLSIIAVLISWREITYRRGFYYFNLMLTIAGIVGVFTAVDMLLFFFFWEVMLLPMTALIAIWGHENRRFAAIKFFIFTQVSSLLMLIAIILMAYLHQQQTGTLSFAYQDWLALELPPELATYMMLGFFIAFAVKLPSFPVHSWLPDAHTQAPTAGSVLLAGVLLKTGAYGLIRFVILLFPDASQNFAPIAALLALASILYGAKMAFAQSDFKRLVAYSSISHMGFVMLALFSFNANAYQGAVITIVAHGLSSAALFSFAGMLYMRIRSRDLAKMGGFWHSAPVMGGYTLAFAAAAFGLPGLANFIGEFFSLIGAFQRFPLITIGAALGIIGSAVYAMVLFQSSFHGPIKQGFIDLSIRERIIAVSLLAGLLIIGIFPNVILQFSFNGGG
ncbi:NADH-quinone oxidoreductase subunit M [Thalassotalea insulae]|uniref:NADH-quinone oxidoreductase subunit M n=1 Tax=Thalassotalea insulae TaxID=2056778 RepID=A0ABQ6GPH4_9GAMM|nr:NADH-quinone oxidoreductase subunit M [Thalassotalea insulae]GLX77504.1 NADH-quinone oxidoreductase subunit M [Thalassotalea insulae]